MRCVFLWQKHTLRYYEKAETSERSRLSCGNSVAVVFGCHAHERGFRHIDDSCARIHFESGRTYHFRPGGICDSSDTLRDILHRDEKFSHLLLVVVYNLPALRCGARSFQTYPDFQPCRYTAGKHGSLGKNRDVYPRRADVGVFYRLVFKDVPVSRSLRPVLYGHQQKILHKNRGFQNLFRRFYARSRHDDDACVFQKFRRNQLGHARYDGVQRNFDKSVFKAARQVYKR